MLSTSFGVVVLDENGRVVDYSIPIDMPVKLLKEATTLSYDVYRVIETIIKELGYSMPRYITLKLDNYEVTVFNRNSKLLVAIVYSADSAVSIVQKSSEATAES